MSEIRESMKKMQHKCTEVHPLRYIGLKAHKSDQTGVPGHESPRINTRAHLSAVQRKAGPGEHQLGSADPHVQSNLDGFPAAQSLAGRPSLSLWRRWLRFSYEDMVGTAIGGYKRRPSPPSFTHTTKISNTFT
jgi:hypothetical protein